MNPVMPAAKRSETGSVLVKIRISTAHSHKFNIFPFGTELNEYFLITCRSDLSNTTEIWLRQSSWHLLRAVISTGCLGLESICPSVFEIEVKPQQDSSNTYQQGLFKQ